MTHHYTFSMYGFEYAEGYDRIFKKVRHGQKSKTASGRNKGNARIENVKKGHEKAQDRTKKSADRNAQNE